jgi:hypothetical protein
MQLEDLVRAITMPKVQLYSLQVGSVSHELQEYMRRHGVVDLGKTFRDFSDTAAAMRALDLIVSVDTSVAHLAGAIGKQCFTLLPYFCCWRWGLLKSSTAWYPTMQLFRQSSPGSWKEPLDQVRQLLRCRTLDF